MKLHPGNRPTFIQRYLFLGHIFLLLCPCEPDTFSGEHKAYSCSEATSRIAECLLQDWMFSIEPVPAAAEQQGGPNLSTIPEEDWEDGSAQPERPSRARTVGLGLYFLLALEADPSLSSIHDLPLGMSCSRTTIVSRKSC